MKTLQALLALFAFAFVPLHAASLADLTYTTTGGEVTITDCDQAASGELGIPDSIGGNPVTNIKSDAFRDCTSLTSILIPDSVTTINSRTFSGCGALTSITIPDGVTGIGSGAFLRCTSLTRITIPDSVSFIGRTAFSYCTSLTGVTIPDSVSFLGGGSFTDCSSLKSITIPDSVTLIERQTFFNCTSLTSITIGNGVTSIEDRAFENCESLTSIIFLGSAPTVGSDLFLDTAVGATALVSNTTFGANGESWNNLTVRVSRADLSGVDLSSADLSGLDLSGSDLSGANLSSANLSSTNLSGVNFSGANLFGANLSDAILTDVNFSEAVLTGVILDNATVENQVLLNYIIRDNAQKIISNTERINQMENQLAILINSLAQKDAVIEEQKFELVQMTTERDVAITERDARPTQAALTEAIAQRDARFTEDQINAMTVDPTVGRNAAGNMQVDISFIHSTDLKNFTPYAVTPELVSVVGGKITLEFPPSDENTFFYRLGVQ